MKKFTGSEMNLIYDTKNGVSFVDELSNRGQIVDGTLGSIALQPQLLNKWGVNKEDFVKKLNELTEEEATELKCEIEKFWSN